MKEHFSPNSTGGRRLAARGWRRSQRRLPGHATPRRDSPRGRLPTTQVTWLFQRRMARSRGDRCRYDGGFPPTSTGCRLCRLSLCTLMNRRWNFARKVTFSDMARQPCEAARLARQVVSTSSDLSSYLPPRTLRKHRVTGHPQSDTTRPARCSRSQSRERNGSSCEGCGESGVVQGKAKQRGVQRTRQRF